MFKKLLFLAFFVLTSASVFSQPAANIQLSGGMSFPLPDLKGTFGDDLAHFISNGNPDSNSYFLKTGFNYGLGVKFPVNRKTLPINIIAGLSINSFTQSKEYNENGYYVKPTLSMSITTLNAGIEFSPGNRKSIIYPYAGASFTLNLFSGSYVEDYIDSSTTYNLSNTARGGIELNAGVDIVLHNNVGLNVAAKYSFANLFGKSYAADLKRTYYLKDDQYAENGITYPAKNITYLQISGGVSFYFGR